MRRIILLSALLVLAAVSCVYADASLFRGSGNIGSVQTFEDSSGVFVPVDDVGKLLGFKASRSGEEVLLTRGNAQLRVIADSVAAWRGISIVPLYSAPFERNGKLWIDTQSAASLFQAFAGTGQNNRLRFASNTGTLAQKVAPEVNAGSKKTAAPVIAAGVPGVSASALPAQPKPQTVSIPQVSQPKPQTAQTPKTAQPEPKQTVAPSERTPTPAISDSSARTPTPAISDSSRPSEIMAASRKAKKAADTPKTPKKQPRLETFRPGYKNTEKAESYSGTINRIRWTHSEGVYNKIMAVVDTDDEADPQVFISGSSIHALFADCLNNAEGLTSPYSNIKTQVKRSSKGVELIFTLSDFTKAEKLVLNDPRRIAFDFFYPDTVSINKAGSSPKTPRRDPAPVIPAPSAAPETPTPRRTSPAVTTPPSTITIPMTTGNVKRKTVVIDPGHGGKDPGASDNGVMEKNVNLAVGLELEKALSARGYRVVMTRNTDVYLTLQERTDIANRENADLFVSVHVNALPKKKSMSGFEIYIMALPTDTDAMNLAKAENREYVEGKGMDVANVDRRTELLLKILGDMQQNNKISESTDFAAALYNAGVMGGLQMRRIAQAPFFVLRGAGMPAVLLEIGFVTNAAESRLLNTPNYQQKIAGAMAAGIVNYLK